MSDQTSSFFRSIQAAVDIVGGSEHPANKVAATITGADISGTIFSLSLTNYWPPLIRQRIGVDVRIGNASGTIHAETACLLQAPCTDGASMFVTDPPCPNCIKNMAEAGIAALYIDHKGFDKDFAQRRGVDFQRLSLLICEKAGIDVYKIFRKERRIETIHAHPKNYQAAPVKPAKVAAVSGLTPEIFKNSIRDILETYQARPCAMALAKGIAGDFMIAADAQRAPGFPADNLLEIEGKYNLILQPTNRILMAAARHGLHIDPDYFFCSEAPSARGLVNLVGAGISGVTIENPECGVDSGAADALRQLQDAGILTITTMD